MPIKIYGLTEFAREIPGMTKSKLSAYYTRHKLPEPTYTAGGRPFWTEGQVKEYKRQLFIKPGAN